MTFVGQSWVPDAHLLSILGQSFFTILITEMGDKTQLLAFLLAARFRNAWAVMAGILVATLLNHALAASVGVWVSQRLDPQILNWCLAVAFVAFALWVLIPDKDDEKQISSRYGAFLTTTVIFFFVEMGDKTQLSTLALGAQHQNLLWVTLGTTAGMLVADGLAIYFSERITRVVPMRWIHRFAAAMFLLYAVWILL